MIQIHLFPSNFHFFSSNNNKTIKKIKKKINKNLHKNNHNNDDSDNVNTTTSTTACISNDDKINKNDDYYCGMIKDANINHSFHCSSSNSKNCKNNNRKQRRKEESVDKSNETEAKNPSISDNTIESIIISSSSLTFSSSSFISSSTKSPTNKITVSNSLIKTNNNLIKFVDVDNHVEDDARNSHKIDDGARNYDDDEMDVVTEALKKSCITVPSKIRFGRRGR